MDSTEFFPFVFCTRPLGCEQFPSTTSSYNLSSNKTKQLNYNRNKTFVCGSLVIDENQLC